MPISVVPIGLYVPVVPVLRSMMNLAVPPELSTQLSVSRASRALPVEASVAASTTTPTVVQPARWTTARNNDGARLVAGPGSDGVSVVNVQVCWDRRRVPD